MEFSDWTIPLLVAAGIAIFFFSRRGENLRIPQGDIHSPPEPLETHIAEPDRESYIERKLQELTDEQFPDNEGEPWAILGFFHRGHITYVELEPEEDEEGYDRFVFAVSFRDPSRPEVLATYSLEGDEYVLLSTKYMYGDEFPEKLPRW